MLGRLGQALVRARAVRSPRSLRKRHRLAAVDEASARRQWNRSFRFILLAVCAGIILTVLAIVLLVWSLIPDVPPT